LEKISLKALAQFVALAEHRSFTRAAHSLNVAQPWLSSRIRELEALLEVTLFDRTPHGTALTEDGALLLEQARRVLSESDRLVTLAADISGRGSPPLRLGAPQDTYYLAKRRAIIAGFTARHPGVPLEICNAQDATLRELIEQDQIEAAFIVGDPHPSLESILVERGRLELLIPEEHPLAAIGDVPLGALKGQPVLAWRREVAPVLWDGVIAPLAAAGAEIVATPECSRWAQIDAAREARLITVVPNNFHCPSDPVSSFVKRRFADSELETSIHFVRASSAARRKGFETFWAFARAALALRPGAGGLRLAPIDDARASAGRRSGALQA
jgi:LysR family transcriptional regulator, benzoate and cis,cis-muconate-responsive activator of ben and cat genes